MSLTIKETQDFKAIKSVLEQYPQGALLEKIVVGVERRTLQRRLRKLIVLTEIYKVGSGRATRYQLKHATVSEDSINVPLAPESRKIRQILMQPLNARPPVGYNSTFLKSYHPNKTAYLSNIERKNLLEIGKAIPLNHQGSTYSKDILSRLIIDLSWNSSRLEGNTYSLLDTQRLIDFGKAAEDKPLVDAQMVLNHKDAIEFLSEPSEEIGFNRYTVFNLHALLSNNLLADPRAEGRLRNIPVAIGGSVYTPLNIPQKISESFDMILNKVNEIEDPFEQSFFIMVHLPYLQPFDDVNKRVSRLCANIPLIKNQLSPLSFIDVPDKIYIEGLVGVYELNKISLLKDLYIWAYERSAHRYAALQKTLGDPDPFRLKYRNEIKETVAYIVLNSINITQASKEITQYSGKIPFDDRQKFIETVDNELLDLHEGNISRYRIKPLEFKKWKNNWQIFDDKL